MYAPEKSDSAPVRAKPALVRRTGDAASEDAVDPTAGGAVEELPFVSVPPSMLLRDAIYTMNEVFATTAAVIDSRGRLVGWLTQSLLMEHFARDGDQALRSPCYALLSGEEAVIAA
jgi:CBS domain-containing protein